jgi:hyperosmotically inducible periplasmic protein
MTSMCARRAGVAASLVVLAALAACGDRVENTEMPQPAQANVEINRQGMEGAKDSRDAVGVQNSGKGARDGYVGSLGAKGDTSVLDPDVLIAEQVKAALASHPDFGSSSKVDVHSREGEVTLVGRAPDPAARERATAIARSVPNVRGVDNQLTPG